MTTQSFKSPSSQSPKQTAFTLANDPIFMAELTRQARVELARRSAKKRDILTWGACLFPDKFYLPFCYRLHNHMVDTRMDEFTNTEAPRNHAKTLIKAFLIPIFQALE